MEFIVTTTEQLSTLIQSAVSRALAPQITSPPKSDRCTFYEALEITGLSKSKLYKLTSSNKIPHKSFGNRLIFSRKELQEWVESQTVDKCDTGEISLALAKSARNKKKGAKHV